ncbi:hypothetical protein [Luteolibacter luteus]|uniref:Uncharacterized protein n=1 Tax=Luteolibacter luteus TaxID=2728835 RepID=A0A858RK69_9BACT|nr:hypothetical protein [Luteolibacter luteus]QJE96799.1 hypothetical protein HHL09_13740 [Luteolibacter luteus]
MDRVSSQETREKGANRNGLTDRSESARKRRDSEKSDDITPDEARKLLSAARENPDIMRRSADCISIIGRLCAAGYTEEAWSMIEEGPGQVRDSELVRFFKAAGLSPAEMISKVENLPYKGEAFNALRGYFSSLDPASTSALLADPSFKEFIRKLDESSPGVLGRAISASLTGRLAFSGSTAEKMAARDLAMRYHADGVLNDGQFVQILKADETGDSFDKWALVANALPNPGRGSDAATLRKDVIEGMVNADAPKALQQLAKVPGRQGFLDLLAGVKKWGNMDPSAAAQWFQTSRNGLNQTQRDSVAMAFYQLALDAGEPEGAEQWAGEISNAQLKQEAVKRLPKKASSEK